MSLHENYCTAKQAADDPIGTKEKQIIQTEFFVLIEAIEALAFRLDRKGR